MRSVELLVPREVTPGTLVSGAVGSWACEVRSPGDVFVEDGLRHLFVLCYEMLGHASGWEEYPGEFTESEREWILSAVPNPRAISINYNDAGLAKAFVLAVADRDDFIVLTDWDGVMTGREFAKRLRASGDDDWTSGVVRGG